jgi:hypothetical protein
VNRYLKPKPLILVCHDGPESEENREVARGFEFIDSREWRGQKAILLGWAKALKWAKSKNLDFIVIAARRYIPLWNWVSTVREDAITQGAVLSRGAGEGLGVLRNEFVSLNVEAWQKAIPYLEEKGSSGPPGAINAMFECLQAANIASDLPIGIHNEAQTITLWPDAINGDRHRPPERLTLWHYYNSPFDYKKAARTLGLIREAKDFNVMDRGGYDLQGGPID